MENASEKVLAIDVGTSGGRHVVGWREGEHVRMQEVYRFSNGLKYNRDGHLVWNTGALYRAVVHGIKKALALFPDVRSLAIDSRGYD